MYGVHKDYNINLQLYHVRVLDGVVWSAKVYNTTATFIASLGGSTVSQVLQSNSQLYCIFGNKLSSHYLKQKFLQCSLYPHEVSVTF